MLQILYIGKIRAVGLRNCRYFSDERMAVWTSTVTGLTTALDLEILLENSGLVSSKFHFYARSHATVTLSACLYITFWLCVVTTAHVKLFHHLARRSL